ncbi:5-dehydro-4-deoxyglucarate dehydratase [Microbacterium dauci]|uniref:Probable 5-dehydro-4-deoxyglucarate dehydratase n=1 Tax=Microbacterium dauci TaxID=3048008 RepID=A0ABT6ZCT7_9MICO|nr:5-dehydro-4-deoxyglucarate dehydratase [Microbacterium sp. LX3-4]MDJ1113821.1 5-dehydro-4-deoxyglucarate dehydratase [Microbacterium sp. LX3-4]
MQLHGVLFFPVTPFDSRGGVAVPILERHLSDSLAHRPGAVFPACGTGEFHALDATEYDAVVRATVDVADGAVPVIAGAGGPLGHARIVARAAQAAGADAVLVLPPYLVSAPQAGLIGYVTAIADATDLPVIVYHRGLGAFTPESIAQLLTDPRVIGVKDGVGDIAAAQQFTLAAQRAGRDDVLFFNGLLTAELSQRAYQAIGVPHYSSAAFAMAPAVATAFFHAHESGDQTRTDEILTRFYEPLVVLRDRVPGYGVSLIKAGLRARGLPVGAVRPPLVDPTLTDLVELERILDEGEDLLR